MLRKLLKYEIPAVARKLFPIYIAWMVVSVLLGISIRSESFSPESITVLTAILYAGMTTAVLVMNLIILVQRYDKDLLGDGGYFTMVLPVKTESHLLNKTISAGLWVLFGSFALILSGILIAAFSGEMPLIQMIRSFLGIPFKDWIQMILTLLNLLLLTFLMGCRFGLMVYTAITFGHQVAKHTSLASICAGLVIIIFEYMVTRILFHSGLSSLLGHLMDASSVLKANLAILIVSLIAVLFSAIYFAICNYMMKNRLNLQ